MVLLVEDNDVNREMLARRLRRRGFQVVEARTGQEALAAAGARALSLVLLDLGLPDIDGWEVARRLKGDPQTAAVPILALTAHAMEGDRERALAAGCDEYETKPINFEGLLLKIARLQS